MRGCCLDLARASVDLQQAVFNVSNVATSYQDQGDRLDLATGTLLPSNDKREGKPDAARPADILGNTAVVDLMGEPVDSDQGRFSGTADTIGYASATSEAHSVYRMRLDVRPIALG